MADSDSEAFESADEEVEEKKAKKGRIRNRKRFDEFLTFLWFLVIHSEDVKRKIPETIVRAPELKPQIPKEAPKIVAEDEPKVDNPLNVETEQKEETPIASSWRSWGAFSVISNASKTVASITTQVSQSIIDSINIPDPEEMARLQMEEKKKLQAVSEEDLAKQESSEKSDDSRFKLDSLISGVSQISSKMVSGGLDTLEGIGKKTINILQETDPNLKSKIRNMNVSSKPNLSDLLKEAKDREEVVTPAKELKVASFELLLDEYKGLVFLEALEILSSQSKLNIELLMKPLSGKVLSDMEETIAEVNELCELDVESFDESLTSDNLQSKLEAATADLNVTLNINEIVNHAKESQQWLEDLEISTPPHTVFEKSIHVLAKSCALSLNNFQKLAELLLSQEHRLTADEADSLSQLATIYCSLFNFLATRFTEKLTSEKSSDENNKMATTVYLEVSLFNRRR